MGLQAYNQIYWSTEEDLAINALHGVKQNYRVNYIGLLVTIDG